MFEQDQMDESKDIFKQQNIQKITKNLFQRFFSLRNSNLSIIHQSPAEQEETQLFSEPIKIKNNIKEISEEIFNKTTQKSLEFDAKTYQQYDQIISQDGDEHMLVSKDKQNAILILRDEDKQTNEIKVDSRQIDFQKAEIPIKKINKDSSSNQKKREIKLNVFNRTISQVSLTSQQSLNQRKELFSHSYFSSLSHLNQVEFTLIPDFDVHQNFVRYFPNNNLNKQLNMSDQFCENQSSPQIKISCLNDQVKIRLKKNKQDYNLTEIQIHASRKRRESFNTHSVGKMKRQPRFANINEINLPEVISQKKLEPDLDESMNQELNQSQNLILNKEKDYEQ